MPSSLDRTALIQGQNLAEVLHSKLCTLNHSVNPGVPQPPCAWNYETHMLADPWAGTVHKIYLRKAGDLAKEVNKLQGFDKLRISASALIEIAKVFPEAG